jgi:hypothetical protein
MSYKYFNVVDLNSRQFPFEIEKGLKIKTPTEEFDITLEDLKEQKMFDLVNSKTNFQVISKRSHFSVICENTVGVMYTEN